MCRPPTNPTPPQWQRPSAHCHANPCCGHALPPGPAAPPHFVPTLLPQWPLPVAATPPPPGGGGARWDTAVGPPPIGVPAGETRPCGRSAGGRLPLPHVSPCRTASTGARARARARRSPHAQTHCRQGRGVMVGGRRTAVPRGNLRRLAAAAEGGGHTQAAYCRRRQALRHSGQAVDSGGGGGSAAESAPGGHHDEERGKPQQLPTIHLRVHTRHNKRPGGGEEPRYIHSAHRAKKNRKRSGGVGGGRKRKWSPPHPNQHHTHGARGGATVIRTVGRQRGHKVRKPADDGGVLKKKTGAQGARHPAAPGGTGSATAKHAREEDTALACETVGKDSSRTMRGGGEHGKWHDTTAGTVATEVPDRCKIHGGKLASQDPLSSCRHLRGHSPGPPPPHARAAL